VAVCDLPRLLGDSFRLVWQAGRPEFLVTAGLQLVTAAGTAAQLFISKAVIDASSPSKPARISTRNRHVRAQPDGPRPLTLA
jgi:hypothetical protein